MDTNATGSIEVAVLARPTNDDNNEDGVQPAKRMKSDFEPQALVGNSENEEEEPKAGLDVDEDEGDVNVDDNGEDAMAIANVLTKGTAVSPQKGTEKQECQGVGGEDICDKTPEEISAIRKKKVALLLSYCGAGYFGMQKNPGVKTIEDELFSALSLTGAIKDVVKDDLGKMSFQRCARTDKGVSATRQVVSLKMVPVKALLPLINKHLPPSIRVFGLIRVTKGFDSKNQCGARTYQYLTPSFAFAPTEMQTVPSYRIKPLEIERVNTILKMMCGTHNFHNFTSGKHPDEASAFRYIMEFTAGSPFVKKGHEFIALSVKGQSFMLHQIRKMIGVCIAICKGFCNEDIIERSWGKNKMDIPKAPGLGLILDMVHFDRYNQRYGSDGLHEKISWEENKDEVDSFKESFIWDTIIESEITHRSMMKWLGTLKNHTYSENRIQGNSKPESDL